MGPVIAVITAIVGSLGFGYQQRQDNHRLRRRARLVAHRHLEDRGDELKRKRRLLKDKCDEIQREQSRLDRLNSGDNALGR